MIKRNNNFKHNLKQSKGKQSRSLRKSLKVRDQRWRRKCLNNRKSSNKKQGNRWKDLKDKLEQSSRKSIQTEEWSNDRKSRRIWKQNENKFEWHCKIWLKQRENSYNNNINKS